MAGRMTERKLVWRCLIEASMSLDSMDEAYGRGNDPAAVEARDLIKRIDRFAMKYYGKTASGHINAPLKGEKRVPIQELWKILSGEKPDQDV